MKTINIGLVGAGTVGSGVIEILKKNRSLIAERTGIDLNLSMICDTNPALAKKYPEIKIVSEYKEITNNASINILIETVGGTGIAFDILKAAISSKKTVVTANKALISEKGNEIFQLAEANNVEIGYEAAVGGTIPVIRTLKTGFVSNNYESIYGILNGTTNFILSKMEEENLDYDKALKEAQDLGFAEKDPTFDVEGIDAAHKLSILGGLAFNIKIPVSKIYIEGISKITSTEIQFAKLLGYRIKLLGICRLNGGLVEARVHPVMIPLSHPIANIMNEMNAIYMH
ncbi:MAG: homoserine dehydrogenase, partial [Leptospira sp.]|nr:homoserine dehydrogenase [Leptospira sp.]